MPPENCFAETAEKIRSPEASGSGFYSEITGKRKSGWARGSQQPNRHLRNRIASRNRFQASSERASFAC